MNTVLNVSPTRRAALDVLDELDARTVATFVNLTGPEAHDLRECLIAAGHPIVAEIMDLLRPVAQA